MQRFAVQASFLGVDRLFVRFVCGKSVKKNKQIRADCEKISTYSRRLVGFIVKIRCWNNVLSYTITGYLIEYSNSYFTAFLFSSVIALFGALGCIKLLLNNRKQAEQSDLEMPLKSIDT